MEFCRARVQQNTYAKILGTSHTYIILLYDRNNFNIP